MAIDLTGIRNENEFYSDHYLRTALEVDLRGWVKDQRPSNGQAPSWAKLKRLSNRFLEQSGEFGRARSTLERLLIQRRFVWEVLEPIGYESLEAPVQVESGILPVIAQAMLQDRPHVWVLEAFDGNNSGLDVLQLIVDPCQVPSWSHDASMEALVSEAFFADEPPRWVLIVSLRTFVLLDRTKWSGRRALRVDWDELYNRPTPTKTFQLIALLLSRQSLCPGSGQRSMLDAVDEQSKAHAQGVSAGLKYALREAVERLGNEYLFYRRTVQHGAILHGAVDAEKLTVECLRYMYRLLFLFTVEARKELAYLPMSASSYRRGYSLEKLRDLELVPLGGNGSGDGYFLHESLLQLFGLVFNGRSERGRQIVADFGEHNSDVEPSTWPDDGRPAAGEGDYDKRTFDVAPLQCNLFDPSHTPLLDSIKVRNSVWQRIIQMLSLGHRDYRGTKGRRGGRHAPGRGRISYAQLGTNHLGAVYEALLSYRGFIAQEDLYEVKALGDMPDPLSPAYFVSRADLEKHYGADERIVDAQGKLVCHPQGRFIYRLTGRAREETASYYTPESLTQCVVRYALEEVLVERKTADDILEITVCEPAMGSAAFLNEAVTQLAEVYLERKSRERGESLTPGDFTRELQRVKMFLADNNVYGVDVNPVAVELGGVSLWLNTLVPEGFVPWFGNQLKCGNSLVGAWRRTYSRSDLTKGRWWHKAPRDVSFSSPRPPGTVYHFLVGDHGMADYRAKVVKQTAGEQIGMITAWRRQFTSKLSAIEADLLERLCAVIDQLWARHIRDLQRLDSRTTDEFPVYPNSEESTVRSSTTREKERHMADFLAPAHGRNASAYQRLKLVMDCWCALWYWPIEKAALLPSRREYLNVLSAVLAPRDEVLQTSLVDAPQVKRGVLGYVDLARLTDELPWLRTATELAQRFRFHHWQLEYADQFATKGGFDVVIGNPPWKKIKWTEKHVIADSEPRFVTQRLSASKIARLRPSWFEVGGNRSAYLEEYAAVAAEATFLNAAQNYWLLRGMQSNLYKSFLTTAWSLSVGAVGLLHPNGVYDDSKGGALRQALYPRLRQHFRFQNALKLFPEVAGNTAFSINVYGRDQRTPRYMYISNLVHPATIERCFRHHGHGPVLGVKTDEGKWELAGHRSRVIRVGSAELALFAQLYNQPGTEPMEARLPALHSLPILQALSKLSSASERLADLEGRYDVTQMWNETNARKADILRRSSRFAGSASEWILSGPHFFVGNPVYQSPNDGCKTKSDYSRLDLTHLPVEYRPRTNYRIVCDPQVYVRRIPSTMWRTPFTACFRVAHRRMLNATGERTLIPTVIPPNTAHIHTVVSTVFRDLQVLIRAMQGWLTIVLDCYVKTTGKADLLADTTAMLPVMPFRPSAAARVLGLVCLTTDYRDLWNEFVSDGYLSPWAKRDTRLERSYFGRFQLPWERRSGLRTDYERRQALVELDVLCAQELGLTLDELCAIYRIQFPVLKSYENDTWYDAKGRIVFSKKKGEGGLPRKRKPKRTASESKKGGGGRESRKHCARVGRHPAHAYGHRHIHLRRQHAAQRAV